jgi:hypothetical protein
MANSPVCAIVAMSMANLAGATAFTQVPARSNSPATACVALVRPRVQGVAGAAGDVAAGVRDLFAKYLSGPSIRTILVDARLESQAMEEVRQKACAHVLTVTLSHTRGGGALNRALVHGAGGAAMFLPGGGSIASAVVRSAAMGGAQAMVTMAALTRANDEIRLEYGVVAVDGSVLVAPKSDKAKAQADGEDIVTPLVERAAIVIAAALGLT